MKNILFLASFPPPYHGGNVDNYHIATYWNSQTSSLICFNISNKKRSGIKIGKLTISNIINNVYLILKYVVHLLYYREYDTIFMNLAQGKWGFLRDSLFILISKIFKKIIICRFPGGDFKLFYTRSNLQYYIKIILRQVDLIITEGKIVNKQFLEINKSQKLANVHIGIPDRYNNIAKNKIQHFEILYICNHRKEKGFWDVVLSIKKIINENRNIIFNFVGELRLSKKEIEYVTDLIMKENLVDNVKFSGVLIGEEKWAAYSNASIQILPSYSEGLPTSIIEGLSFGLPIIASSVGVLPEIIMEGVNGFLIRPGDQDTLIDRILQLSRDVKLVEYISKKNREYYLEKFTIESFCNQLDKVLLSAL